MVGLNEAEIETRIGTEAGSDWLDGWVQLGIGLAEQRKRLAPTVEKKKQPGSLVPGCLMIDQPASSSTSMEVCQ
jgi:hypothetical protein